MPQKMAVLKTNQYLVSKSGLRSGASIFCLYTDHFVYCSNYNGLEISHIFIFHQKNSVLQPNILPISVQRIGAIHNLKQQLIVINHSDSVAVLIIQALSYIHITL
jgi:hypothetical protein